MQGFPPKKLHSPLPSYFPLPSHLSFIHTALLCTIVETEVAISPTGVKTKQNSGLTLLTESLGPNGKWAVNCNCFLCPGARCTVGMAQQWI